MKDEEDEDEQEAGKKPREEHDKSDTPYIYIWIRFAPLDRLCW